MFEVPNLASPSESPASPRRGFRFLSWSPLQQRQAALIKCDDGG